MLKIKSVDMLHGSLIKAILIYSIPVILVGLIQSLFNAVDIMVLGFVASDEAVASVGATSAIIALLVNTFFGLSSGVKIVLARLIGAEEEEKTKKTVSTSMIASFASGVIVAVVGFLLSPFFLRITACPAECFDGALVYMRLYLAAAPAIMVYNFGSAIISTSGDSQRPLYYMMISGGLNVVLNFALCMLLPNKVAAVAISTAVSQMVGAVLVVMRLCRMDGLCKLDLRKLSWSNSAFGRIFANGAPIALSNALYPLANLQIQTQINSFGPYAIAGNSAMASIEGLVGTIASSPWATSVSVFVGQNLGAKKYDRVKKSILYLLIIAASCGLVLGLTGALFSRQLLSLYVSEDAAIKYGQIRMMYTLVPYIVCCVNAILSHVIQAFGYSMFSSANSIVSVLVFRIIWMEFVYPHYQTFDMLTRCFFVSWMLVLVVNVAFTSYIYFGKFKKGRLKLML